MLEEIDTIDDGLKSNKYCKSNSPTELVIGVDDLSVRWDTNLAQPSLDKIRVNLKRGELLAVIGSVGSGKVSHLLELKCLLNSCFSFSPFFP